MKWLLILVSLFVVLVGALAVAPGFFDWNQYKAPVLKQVAEVTGLDVRVEGDVSLALLPSPRVYLERVSVQDPTDGQAKILAAFDLLDVRVALMPLFQGQARVDSIHLKKPQVFLKKDEQGRFNFMTPKLEAMAGAKKALENGGKPAAGAQNFSVSFNDISITDGVFVYRDAAAKGPVELSGVNLDLEADTLEGPFKAEGALVYNGQPVRFEAKTGKLDKALQSTSLNLKAAMSGMEMRYAGVVSGGEAPEIQGEASVSIASLAALLKKGEAVPKGLSGGLSVRGLLSANAREASLKNADLEIAGKRLSGAVDVSMNPVSVKGAFAGQDIVDLDALLGGDKAAKSGGFDPSALGGLLPATLEIPALGTIDLALNVPGVIFKGQVVKDVRVKVQNTQKSFAATIDAGGLPGQGRAQILGALSYAEKSRSQKTQKDIYSAPVLAFELKGETQNFPVTVQAFTGLRDLPLVKDAKRGVFEFAGQVRPSGVSLDKGVVNMDEAAYSVSGAWAGQKDTPRSLLKAKVVAGRVDFDSLGGSGGAPVGGGPLKPLKTLALPYDVDLDLTVNDAVLQGHELKGLKLAASLRPNVLKVGKLAADNFIGSSLNASGSIGDLKNMAGLSLDAAVDTPDPYKLAGAFKVDTASWPQDLGRTKANVRASGSLSALDVDAGVEAFGGEVGVVGKVSNPLTQLEIGGLAFKLRHSNMAKAIQAFAPGAPNYVSLAKPMRFDADLVMNGKVTELKNIKADLAGASTTGALRIDASGAKPSIAGTLRIGDLVLKSGNGGVSGSSAGQSGAVSGSRQGGKWSSAPMDTAWLHAVDGVFDIAANSIVYETWDLKKPALKMTLQNGVMNISDLQAGLYDGQIGMSASISSTGPKAPMNVKSAARIDNINLGALAKALSGTRRIEASGDVSLDFDVSGAGGSQSALVGSLQGAANLNGANVVMKGFDLAGLAQALVESNKPLPRIQQILSASTSGGETAFDTVKGAYEIENGQVNISSMAMDGPAALIVSTGHVSLPRWYMDTKHQITLKNAPNVAPVDVQIKGPLDNPGNTFGKGLFEGFVGKRLTEKLPELLGDDVSEKLQKFGILPPKQEPAAGHDELPANENIEPSQPEPQQKEIKPEDVVNDLLKGFLGQ
ncbi:MAG: AsmA family protein [Alphaproteobacteria bacterium]